MKQKRFYSCIAGAFTFACLLGTCKAETAPPTMSATKPLDIIIAKVANNRVFRMTSENLEMVVAPYCKKIDSGEDEYDKHAKLICNKESGINEINFVQRTNEQQGRFIFSLAMTMPLESYISLKMQTVNQLGRPARNGRNYMTWNYTGDKKLNNIGNPMFRLERHEKEKISTFDVGIEAGP